MSAACWICLQPLGSSPGVCGPDGQSAYHPQCLQALFGRPVLPRIPLVAGEVVKLAQQMVGQQSLSGAQPKLALALASEPFELQATPALSQSSRLSAAGASYILKPANDRYRHVPENEHLSMQLAQRVGIATAACGLFALADGTLAYLVRRFDRGQGSPPGKLLVEDFCSLAGKKKEHKYLSSTEECFALLRRFATAPEQQVPALYRLFVFSYWIGNGDLHLKNLSLLRDPAGHYRLSPAYDLVNTAVLTRDRELALPVVGRLRSVLRKQWLELAANPAIGLSSEQAGQLIDGLLAHQEEVDAMVAASALLPEQKQQYRRVLRKRGRALS